MSQENIEIAQRAYEAWNSGDYDATIAYIDPEIDWAFVGETRFPGTQPAYHGHEGVREFWRIFIEPWEEFSIEIEDARDAGDAVVLFVVFHGRVSSGPELQASFTHVVWFRDGKCFRLRAFDDRKAALEAAGLSE